MQHSLPVSYRLLGQSVCLIFKGETV